MSKEWMQKILINLRFTEIDTQVYVYLTTERAKKARDIADALKIPRKQLYFILKKLQSKGIVNRSSDYPARFSAVSFEQILDLFINARIAQHEALLESKEELLSTWWTIIKKNSFHR